MANFDNNDVNNNVNNNQVEENIVIAKQDISNIGGKAFNVTLTKGMEEPVKRTLYSGKDKDGNPVRFLPQDYFLSHEVSQFLNTKFGKFTWGDYITDRLEVLEELVMRGYTDPDTNIRYVCVFANWRDRAGKAILVEAASGITKLADMGIYTRMAVINESMKTAKYLNRMFAPADEGHMPVWGKEQKDSWDADTQECIVELRDGQELIVKFIELKDLTAEGKANKDGHIGLSTRAHSILGLTDHPELGDSFRVTVFTERKFGKGHTIYQPDQQADIVIYGGKKHVFGTEFCFMSLGPLHSGNPHTDIQSVTNFKLGKLAEELANRYMRHVYATAHNDKAVVSLLRQTLRAPRLDENEEGALTDMIDRWSLRKALENAISIYAFPGTYRAAVRQFIKGVRKAEAFRIPMALEGTVAVKGEDGAVREVKLAVATSKYVSGDPFAIDESGMPDMEKSVIPEGYICIPDLPAGLKVVVYRQPNENSNAFYRLTNMHHEKFKAAAGKAVAYLGRGADKVMARLGGGDMDDNIIIVTDPKWVAHFDTLSYPETDKLQAVESGTGHVEADTFEDLGFDYDPNFDVSVFGPKHMMHQIGQSTSRDMVGIGPVVNVNMIDMICSDKENKESMLRDIAQRQLGEEFYNALSAREDFQTNFLATNLELVIDAAVKDPGELAALQQEVEERGSESLSAFIQDFHKATKVYPVCMAIGRNRIPATKRDKGDFILAYSEQCRSQERIIAMSKYLQGLFVKNEWVLVKKADPVVLDLFVQDEFLGMLDREYVNETVNDMRRYWRELWSANSQAVRDNPDNANDNIYADISKKIEQVLNQLDPHLVEGVALELYRQVYLRDNPPVNYDTISDKARSYHDGLLWTNRLANAFIDLLARNGLTGQIVPVRLHIEKGLGNRLGVKIRVKSGIAYLLAGGEAVGEINLPDQIYTMNYGLVFVKAAHESLRAKYDLASMFETL